MSILECVRPGVRARRAVPLRRPALLALALLALPAAARAQQQPRTITFSEAIEIALQRNPTLRQARNTAELDSVSIRQQKMQFVPDLRLNTTSSQQYGRYFDQDEGRILTQSTNSTNTGVSSSLTVFNGFANRASLAQARLTASASERSVERASQSVVFTVMSNFLALVEQQEQLRVQQENLRSQEAQEQQIDTYVKAGVRPISDLYQQQAAVASARLTLVQTERALDLARLDLVQTLQLDPLAEYEFQAPPLGAADTTAALPELAELSARALANREDVHAAEARLQASQQGLRIARGSRWPTVSLSASYGSGFNSSVPTSVWEQMNDRRGGGLGLNLSIPVFDRLSSSNATQRARIQEENARIELESVHQQVTVELRRAYLDQKAARAQLSAAEAQMAAAQLALQTAQQRYDVGAATLVELSQARAVQVQAASDLVSARYGLLFQQRVLGYYTGDFTVADVVQP
jgi:outer membrane protein